MKNTTQFSSEEVNDIIDQLEGLMVNIQRQSTDDHEAIQEAFPTLDRSAVDRHLAEGPATSDDMIRQTKQLVQYLIGKIH